MANPQDKDNIFGLKKGMSKSEIEKLKFGDLVFPSSENDDNDSFYVINPKNIPQSPNRLDMTIVPPHLSFFENGLISFSLVWEIRGFDVTEEGAKRQMNTWANNKYEELREILIRQYGQGKGLALLASIGGWHQTDFSLPNTLQLKQVRLETRTTYDESRIDVSVAYDFADIDDYKKKRKAYKDSLF